MGMERTNLVGSLNLEQMAPASPAPGVQAQASREGEEGKLRRRPPPESALAEATAEDEDGKDSGEERPPHRLDDLA
jgi:hypothetical protein